MENEIWKDIPEYEGLYQASNLGRIRSKRIGVMNQHLRGRYLGLNLNKNGKKKSYNTHRLIAITFLDNNLSGHKMVVDHIDNNPQNNRLENLQIITQRENASKDKKPKTSKYVGVHKSGRTKKWKASITLNGTTKYLGLFKTEEEAHFAYQKELNKIKD